MPCGSRGRNASWGDNRGILPRKFDAFGADPMGAYLFRGLVSATLERKTRGKRRAPSRRINTSMFFAKSRTEGARAVSWRGTSASGAGLSHASCEMVGGNPATASAGRGARGKCGVRSAEQVESGRTRGRGDAETRGLQETEQNVNTRTVVGAQRPGPANDQGQMTNDQ
jgi:hypothetical protein